jgi:hypothetical protein
MKQIDSALAVTYAIAVLTTDHADRMFLMHDPYRNRLVWSRTYRPAVMYATVDHARATLREIEDGGHAHLLEASAGIDPATMAVLETTIQFQLVPRQ